MYIKKLNILFGDREWDELLERDNKVQIGK